LLLLKKQPYYNQALSKSI